MYGLGVNVMLDIARPKVHLMIQIVHSIDFKGLAEKHTRSFFLHKYNSKTKGFVGMSMAF